jgi:hypothetical protein
MEKSFSPLEDLIASRLIRVGNISKREASNLSKATRKKRPQTELFQEEQKSAREDTAAVEAAMEAIALSGESELTEPDFVRMEKNIAGFGFFTPSSKRIKNVPKVIKFSHTIDGNRVEAQVKISGNVEYGMPITADQDKYLAFQKIIERVKKENGTVSNPVTFQTSELLALLDISKNGNRYKEVEEWLDVMNTTYIKSEGAVWLNGKKRYASDSFVIFQRVRRVGQELDDGNVAEKNYVWLSDWYLENLNAHYLLPIEFETYRKLKNNIAKALIPLLQIWLYASRDTGVFEKRYSEICQILNIREYQYKSKITEKLAPSFNELIAQGYLRAWEVERTSDGKDFKIVFRHGHKFYADQTTLKQLSGRKGKKGENRPAATRKAENLTKLPEVLKEAVEAANFAPEGILGNDAGQVKAENLPDTMTAEHLEAIRVLHIEYRVVYDKAVKLVRENLAETMQQLAALPFREGELKNKAGFLIEAIEQKYSLPESYFAHLREREAIGAAAARQEAIDACPMCDELGWRNVKSEQDNFYGVMHQCTHDPEIEAQFEDHTM